MRIARHAILWVALLVIAALIVLSAYGALIGADSAKELFNSIPLVVFWCVLAVLLLGGFVAFPRLVKSPASLLMHLAPLFILAGAMWGSEKAHEVRRSVGQALMPTATKLLGPSKADQFVNGWLGAGKVPTGYIALHEGEEDNRILDRETQQPVAELPFKVRLKSFTIDYYPLRDDRWSLLVGLPVYDADGKLVDERQQTLPWEPDREIPIPGTLIRLRVLQYLPHAGLLFEKGTKPCVEITTADGQTVTLPAEVGKEVELKNPPLKIRVEKLFVNLRVQGAGAERQFTDAPGEQGAGPAVAVTLTQPDGTSRTRYLMALMPMHGQAGDGLAMSYVLPQPTGATPDPESKVPAMEVQLTADGRSHRVWLLPQEGDRRVSISLAPLVPAAKAEAIQRGLPALYLAAPQQDVKAYKSDVEIIEDYRRMAHKVVEVNHPLHYGGYHFYQHSYGNQGGMYSVFSVVSDSGLWPVWIGFGMLCAAAVWRMWLTPAWVYLKAMTDRVEPGPQ
jgi:hypothetical protein